MEGQIRMKSRLEEGRVVRRNGRKERQGEREDEVKENRTRGRKD